MSKDFNYIVRLQGTSLSGTKEVPYALCEIKGVGIRVARTVIKKLDINPRQLLGNLSDADIKRLEVATQNLAEQGLPYWMLNRRKDLQTGKNLHLLTSDLTLRIKEDTDLMKEIRSWKGDRHSRGLKVRGQRTKTTARKGRSVGVSRRRM